MFTSGGDKFFLESSPQRSSFLNFLWSWLKEYLIDHPFWMSTFLNGKYPSWRNTKSNKLGGSYKCLWFKLWTLIQEQFWQGFVQVSLLPDEVKKWWTLESWQLYWILLLSTNICKSRFDFDIYLTIQSFRCKRTLISGVSGITGTILNHKRSKTQKVKVAAVIKPLSLKNTWSFYCKKTELGLWVTGLSTTSYSEYYVWASRVRPLRHNRSCT